MECLVSAARTVLYISQYMLHPWFQPGKNDALSSMIDCDGVRGGLEVATSLGDVAARPRLAHTTGIR